MAVDAPCPSCGEPAGAGDTFCEACGHSLSGPAAVAGPPPPAVPAAAADGQAAPPAAGADLLAKARAAAAVARATARAAAPPAGAPSPPAATAAPLPTGTGMGPPDAGSEEVACPACGAVGEWYDGYCGTCGAKRPDPRDHTELERAGVAAVSDKGRRHAKNEDSYAVVVGDGFVVAVVCDGVSTTVVPEQASQAAADAAAGVLAAGAPSQADFDAAFDAARSAVLAVEFQPHADLGPPSCTYLAAVVTGSSVRLSAFGDCRAYWVAPTGEVEQLTVDDSWATHQIAAGMAPAQAYADNRAHAITRWLGADADPEWRPAAVELLPRGPGRLLLVSDGVWNYAAEPHQLAALLRAGPERERPLELARRLVEFANAQGGADNITAVVVDLPLQPGDAARPPEAP